MSMTKIQILFGLVKFDHRLNCNQVHLQNYLEGSLALHLPQFYQINDFDLLLLTKFYQAYRECKHLCCLGNHQNM